MTDKQVIAALRELAGQPAGSERSGDRAVIVFIAGGCFAVLLAILSVMAWGTPPDWAESLFSAVAGGLVVKLADCLSALVALSSSRSVERLGTQLATSTPTGPLEATIVNSSSDPVPVEAKP